MAVKGIKGERAPSEILSAHLTVDSSGVINNRLKIVENSVDYLRIVIVLVLSSGKFDMLFFLL